jgi:hypothetical protein
MAERRAANASGIPASIALSTTSIRDVEGLHWDRPAPDPTPIANYELF